jgi:hypothetical protein
MAHPVVSSGSMQTPALVSVVTGKEPKAQKEKKPKAVLASQYPLEVRWGHTVIT